MKPKEPENKLPDPSRWTTIPDAKGTINPVGQSAQASNAPDSGVKRGSTRREQLLAAVQPRGSGSGGPAWVHTPPIDYPLQPCEFTKWARYDSLPIERACFVLFGFDPPPLAVLLFQQNDWNPTRELTYDVPPEYSDALDSLWVSIQRGNVSARRITEFPYETQHVTWPDLVRWAKAKGFTIPAEVEAIVATMDHATGDARKHQADNKLDLSEASPPLEDQAKPVVAPEPQDKPGITPGVTDDAEPAKPNWKMRIQIEATAYCLGLQKSGASPTVRSILDPIAAWCRANKVMTDSGIFPSANYPRTHILGGKHWQLPR